MKRYRVPMTISIITSLLVIIGWLLVRDVHFDVLMPVGEIAKQQKDLLLFTLILSAVVVLPVFAMLVIFAWKYREGNHNSQYKPEWHDSKLLEFIWWGVPIVIIVILAIVTWTTSHSLDPYRKIESSKPAIEVQVVALQWKWLFIYPDLGVATLNQLPVPVDTPVHFTLTADAPMSAFWVPALGSQIYTMKGMSSQLNLIANQTGDFPGYTTNINGNGYSGMKFMVHSQSQDSFDAWVKQAAQSTESMDRTMYESLAKPESIKDERQYKLTEHGLYDFIIEKFMPMHNGSNHEYSMEGM